MGAVVVVRVLGLRRDRRRGRVADAVDDVIVLVGIVAVLLDGDGLPRGVLRRRQRPGGGGGASRHHGTAEVHPAHHRLRRLLHARVDLGLQRLTVRSRPHDVLEILERGLEQAEVRPRLRASVVPLDVRPVALDGRRGVHLRVGVFANFQTRRRAVREQNRLGPSFGGDPDGLGVQLVRFEVFRAHKRGVTLLLERLGQGLARDVGHGRIRRVGLRGPGLAERWGLWPRAPRVPGAFRSLRR